MRATEILVIVFGLFLGYWVVSKLFLGKAKESAPADPEHEFKSDPGEDRDTATNAWHLILDVAPDATTDEIRRSYKTLMSQYHPDKVAALGDDLKALAERKTKEINSAYQRAMQQRGVDA